MAERDDWFKPRDRGTHLTDAEKQRIREGFRKGERIAHVARELACSSRIVGKYYAIYRSGLTVEGSCRVEPRPMTDAQLRRYRATLPEDTRDLTARFCGDPLPGRSALDKRRAA